MSQHTIDMTTLAPAPEVCALQKALEALEAAEVDLYPRDVQPTHVVRNRIQFAAFVLRRQLDAGVALRRHAAHVRRLRELLGTGKSLLLTPLSLNGTDVRSVPMPSDIAKRLVERGA